MSEDEAYVLDMLSAAQQALEYVSRVDKEAFLKDRMVQDAVVRQLEILGEAAGKVSTEFRDAHPEVDWGGPAGMRIVLAHRYRSVDLDRVWETVKSDLPGLVSEVKRLIPEEP